jgi:hypothetical protein
VELELYCESVALVQAPDAAGTTVSATSTQPATTQTSAASTATDTLATLLAAATFGTDAQRALRVLQASSFVSSPDLVAARLKATTIPVPPVAGRQRTRADGESLGERWASDRASLEELQEIAPLETGDWSSIQLRDEHTLVAQLRQSGIVPPGGEGAMQLTRDEFVEGLVAGAARVLRSAQLHLGGG